MSDKNIFSKDYYDANKKIEDLQSKYHDANTVHEKDMLEFIAFVESNLGYLHNKFKGSPNSEKRDLLLKHIDKDLYKISDSLYDDRAINKYLNRRGFLSPFKYFIIELLFAIIMSIIALIVAKTFINLTIVQSLIFIAIAIIGVLLYEPLLHINFYRIKK